MKKQLIAYYRVSTQKQGDSGLGLEAQQQQVEQYARQQMATITQSYLEVESGKRADRPELAKAIAHARRIKGILVIAKLDRLARNVAFVATLMEAGCEFVAVDNPTANRLTVHILAAVAEDEARRISERTKAALAAAKARGTLLGSARPGHWDGREDARRSGGLAGIKASARKRTLAAIGALADIIPLMLQWRGEGMSLRAIAGQLNSQDHRTAAGNQWSAKTVLDVLNRSVTTS